MSLGDLIAIAATGIGIAATVVQMELDKIEAELEADASEEFDNE